MNTGVQPRHVAVCCTTCRRPDGLQRLLDGLNAQSFDKTPAPRVTVIIVDNDPANPVSRVVDQIRPGFRFGLVYDVEPVPGVASARNRCLDLVPDDAAYVATIDDDEVPVPAWLDELLAVALRSGAAFVQGPVQPFFQSDPPGWLAGGRFLELGPYRDGAPLDFGYSGNSLMETAAIRRAKLRFDPTFNLSGGEDQRFFGQALEHGLQIVTSKRGIVREWVPPGRASLAYLLKRRFRMGNTLAAIDRLEDGASRTVVRSLKGLAKVALGLIQIPGLAYRGAAGPVTGFCNIAWGAGALAGAAGFTYQEYARPPAPSPPNADLASGASLLAGATSGLPRQSGGRPR